MRFRLINGTSIVAFGRECGLELIKLLSTWWLFRNLFVPFVVPFDFPLYCNKKKALVFEDVRRWALFNNDTNEDKQLLFNSLDYTSHPVYY